MGACNIEFELKGDATREDVKTAFNRQRERDAAENGHASGYSGDFQTVNRIDFHDNKVFSSENEAQEYCLKHAIKWETVVAVKYEVRTEIKPDAKARKLDVQTRAAFEAKRDFETKLRAEGITSVKAKAFATCKSCKSRLNTGKLTRTECPVCGQSLLQAKELKQLVRLVDKHAVLARKLAEHTKYLQTKTKVKTTQWLVCGWGAC